MLIQANPQETRHYSGRAIVWKHLGELDIALGDCDEAIRLYHKALRLVPKNAYAYLNRGLAGIENWEFDNAIADDGEVLRLDLKLALACHNRTTSAPSAA